MEKESKRILFLYSELAEYFVSALKVLLEQENVEVIVVHWPINPEAPFKFNFPKSANFIDKSTLTFNELNELVSSFKPHTIISSGWMDKDYLRVCKKNFNKATTVVSLDNHWRGSLKQRILSFLSPFYLKRVFKTAWVPGDLQLKYAHKLGFKDAEKHFYAPDISYYQDAKTSNPKPHRFLYIGRYVNHKGIYEMWEAFKQLKQEDKNDWELWCLGTGEEYENRVEHESIKHFGFVQPTEILDYLKKTSVFVLPSKFEPWGVVVHEMAAAGLPLLLSDKIGSKSSFLREGLNGFEFKGGSINDLKKAMLKIINLSDEELQEMGEESSKLAQVVNQSLWAKTVVEF